MGFSWKKALGIAINPVAAIGTGLAVGSDVYSAYEQRKATEEANRTSAAIAERELAAQKEFAQMGIRWRVEDAKAAGIHPLAALGAAGAAYSPSGQQIFADYSKSDLARNLGQDIRGAIRTGMTLKERQYNDNAMLLELRNRKLQGDLLEAEIEQMRKPPFPQSMNMGTDFATEAGLNATRSFDYRPDGSLMVNPNIDYMQKNQEVPFAGTQWAIKNRLVPWISDKGYGQNPSVSEYPVPPMWGKVDGKDWTHWLYDSRYGGYVPGRVVKDRYGNEKLLRATDMRKKPARFYIKDEMFE